MIISVLKLNTLSRVSAHSSQRPQKRKISRPVRRIFKIRREGRQLKNRVKVYSKNPHTHTYTPLPPPPSKFQEASQTHTGEKISPTKKIVPVKLDPRHMPTVETIKIKK